MLRLSALILVSLIPLFAATPETCNQAADKAVIYLDMPGRPFEPIPSADGCWVFVSLVAGPVSKTGIGVVQRSEGKLSLKREVPVRGALSGMTLTHDGKLLIAGTGNGVLFLDPALLISGQGDPIVGEMQTSFQRPSASYVSVTSDDRYLFISNESAGTISVIELEGRRKIVGEIPVGRAPIAVTLSPDDRYVYSTSEAAPASYGWPDTCAPEQPGGQPHPPGAVMVVDVNRAKTDPAHSVIAKAPAGCSPVRLVLSPDASRAYVTARSNNALLIFDTAKLLRDPLHAQTASITVRDAPVGVAVVEGGRKIVVANSNRFSHDQKKQTLSVIDAATNKVIGSIPAQLFPRELRVTTDGRTLLLTNFASKTLEMVDLGRIP